MLSSSCKRAIFLILFVFPFVSTHAQKGETSLYGGLFVSFPIKKAGLYPEVSRGIGLEAAGQYNISNKSSLLIQSNLLIYINTIFLKGGYQYNFSNSGLFINILTGSEIDLSDGFTTISFTLGIGKRFQLNERFFINAGVDYVDGDVNRMLNIKSTFGLILN